MAKIRFPQLHDHGFLARTLKVPAAQLAEELGCRPSTVKQYRQEHRLLQQPRWNDVQLELLAHFYGHSPVACLCEGLRRTRRAVYLCAQRSGLKSGKVHRASPAARARFWPAWQGHIRDNLSRWAEDGVAEGALDLLWRPPTEFLRCQECAHLSECRASTGIPLRCERLTVREALQAFDTEERS